jgi:hypothetical protein
MSLYWQYSLHHGFSEVGNVLICHACRGHVTIYKSYI